MTQGISCSFISRRLSGAMRNCVRAMRAGSMLAWVSCAESGISGVLRGKLRVHLSISSAGTVLRPGYGGVALAGGGASGRQYARVLGEGLWRNIDNTDIRTTNTKGARNRGRNRGRLLRSVRAVLRSGTTRWGRVRSICPGRGRSRGARSAVRCCREIRARGMSEVRI